MESKEIVNIAGYRFVNLVDRDELRQPFRFICEKLNLKGTILLSKNGINFFLAGEKEDIDSYIKFLESDERFLDIPCLLYTSPSPRDATLSRMPSSA